MPTTLPTFDFAQRLPGRFDFPARMTVLPLPGEKLALVSPVPIDDAVAGRLGALGDVSFLIAPNLLHHLHLGPVSQRYPNARVLAPRRLSAKRPELRIDGALEDGLPAELGQTVDAVKVDGTPALDEFVFFHRPMRTLVVTDWVFNIVKPRGLMAHLVLSAVGCHGRLGQSRAIRFMVKDRAAASESAQRILSLGFDTVVPAHGDILHDDARARMAHVMRWLLPRPQVLPAAL
jgi:hypothetical protein